MAHLRVCVRELMYVYVFLCVCLCVCVFSVIPRHHAHRYFGGGFVRLCVIFAVAQHLSTAILLILVVLLYIGMCKTVIVSFLLLLFIGTGQPLFRNFGCTFVCVCMHVRACVYA